MDHLLNLSTAAKLVGVSRGTIQSKIKLGELETFEGHIRVSSLTKVFPEIENKKDPIIERMTRLREHSMWEAKPKGASAARVLAAQVHQLQLDLDDAHAKIESYDALFDDLTHRLSQLGLDCDREEKQKLDALIHWLANQL